LEGLELFQGRSLEFIVLLFGKIRAVLLKLPELVEKTA
jgi:hypothetical protein